jgi:hypothetical protein
MGLFDVFKSKQFEELFEKALEEEMTNSQSKNQIYSEITNCYFMILSLLNVNSFKSFQFPDYEDCRKVVVDGKEYDFDNEFHHNDRNATEMLCTIDCLIADLEDDIEAILGQIEKNINSSMSNS